MILHLDRHINEPGVMEGSYRYYHEADRFAQENLYTVPQAGAYICNSDYIVSNVDRDICQLIIVDSGEMGIHYEGKYEVVTAGMVAVMNCRKPYTYYACTDVLKIRWLHFAGNNSLNYTEHLIRSHGFVIKPQQNRELESYIQRIIMATKSHTKYYHIVAVDVHHVLALLMMAGESNKSDIEQRIDGTVQYINEHYGDPTLNIEYLSNSIAFSPCYYVRKFKQYYECTPHQYILNTRLRMSKEMLLSTIYSVEYIAELCGFCNASHFISAFKRNTQLTPTQYRKM